MRSANRPERTEPAALRFPMRSSVRSVQGPANHRRARRARSIAAVAAVAAVLASSCSSGDSAPDVLGAVSGERAVGAATITSGSSWGAGRARLATQSADGTLFVTTTTGTYRVEPGAAPEQLAALPSGSQPSAIATSPDGTTVAVGLSSPPSVLMFDTAGEPTPPREYLIGVPVRTLRFDGERLLIDTPVGPLTAAAQQAPVRLLDDPAAGTSAPVATGALVVPIAATPDLAVVATDGSIERRSLQLGEGATVLDVRSSPNGAVLAVTSGVGENLFERQDRITVLDAASFTALGSIEAGVALDPTQWTLTDTAAVIADGPSLRAFRHDGTPIDITPAVDSSVAVMTPVPDGLVTIHADGTIVVRSSDAQPASVLGSGVSIESATLTGDSGSVVTTDRHGAITVRRTTDGAPTLAEDRFASGELTDIAVAPDGRIAVASSLGEVTVLDDALVEQDLYRVTDIPARVDAVSFDPVTSTIAAGVAERVSESAFDDTVRAWDSAVGSERFRTGGEAEDVSGCSFFYSRVRFAPDGSTVAITSHDFTVQIVDTATGAVLQTLAGVTTVLDLAFTPDGTRLIATYDDAMVRIWSTDTYAEVASYRGVQGGYYAIATVPGSSSMAAADITGAINLIDIETGTVQLGFADATNRTFDIAVSADGALLAAPTADGGVTLWSTADGARLATAVGHAGAVTGIAFSLAGDRLATSSTDGTVRTWDVQSESG